MKQKVLISLGVVAALLLVRNIWTMLTHLPDEAFQGAIFRIIFFHVPAAFTAFLCFFAALISGIAYLKSQNLKWDAFAVSVTEVGLAFGAANLEARRGRSQATVDLALTGPAPERITLRYPGAKQARADGRPCDIHGDLILAPNLNRLVIDF